jgi:UDP-N-acetyl-2-amino-2-deoxyglucuronate dehydrogenase
LLGAIAGENVLLVDGHAGRRVIELVMAIYQFGTTGKKVRLPMTSNETFYTHQAILQHAPRFQGNKCSTEQILE